MKCNTKCGTKCHEVRGNRYCFFIMARRVSENMQFSVGADAINYPIPPAEQIESSNLKVVE